MPGQGVGGADGTHAEGVCAPPSAPSASNSNTADPLVQVVDALEQLDIPYVVVGSFASTFWGRPRTTHDADLVVEMTPEQARSLAGLLEGRFYAPDFVLEAAARKHDQFNVVHLGSGFKIDLWPVKDTEYDRQAFHRHLTGTVLGRDMQIISAEDVILSKLRWYRSAPVQDRQLQDVLAVLQGQAGFLDDTYSSGGRPSWVCVTYWIKSASKLNNLHSYFNLISPS